MQGEVAAPGPASGVPLPDYHAVTAGPPALPHARVTTAWQPVLIPEEPVLVHRRRFLQRAASPDVPLFMVPHLVRWRVKEFGQRLYRVSVARTHWHHYTVKVRCRCYREIPARTRRQSCLHPQQRTLDDLAHNNGEAAEDG